MLVKYKLGKYACPEFLFWQRAVLLWRQLVDDVLVSVANIKESHHLCGRIQGHPRRWHSWVLCALCVSTKNGFCAQYMSSARLISALSLVSATLWTSMLMNVSLRQCTCRYRILSAEWNLKDAPTERRETHGDDILGDVAEIEVESVLLKSPLLA